MVDRFTAWICGVRGHDDVLTFADGVMALRCTSCLRLSPGWDLREPRRMVRMPLSGIAFGVSVLRAE